MSGGGGFERVVAEGFEDVIAAFEQFAGEREAGAVAADPLGQLEVEFPRFCGVLSTCDESVAGRMDWNAEIEAAVPGAVPA